MRFENLRVTILNRADKSDPGNCLLRVIATAAVDGERCGWSVLTAVEAHEFQENAIERAVQQLILKILSKPKNVFTIEGLPPEIESVTYEIPEVAIDEAKGVDL